MSASEKLKALDETFKASKNQREQADYLYRMTATLPQIVAVVEEAENAREIEDYVLSEYTPEGTKLQRALAALDEALT